MLSLDDLVDDPDGFTWDSLATCRGLPAEFVTARKGKMDILFDTYESDCIVAEQTDQMCLGCPVAKQCLEDGIANKLTGVRGGVYLENGKPAKARNLHKTDLVWKQLSQKHGRNIRV